MKKKVAVFPAGSEIGLEINRALKYSTFFDVIGFSSMKDHTRYVYKEYIEDLPFINDENFIDELNKRIEEKKIDFIYPANDDVQLYLTLNQKSINAKIITSEEDTVKICRSKKSTYSFLKKEKFLPEIYEFNKELKFPLFIKPNIGQGSKGAKIINSLEELLYEKEKNIDLVICEYLPGEEYTIDCFTDFEGKLRVVKQRNRKRIRIGISVNSKILELDPKVEKIANIINNYFKFNGAWFFQLKKDKNDEYKLLEIAPRISGTMGLSRNTGINFPLLTLFNEEKIVIKIIQNTYQIEVDRAFINRYKIELAYNYIYVDLDDTLINNKKVNSFLLMFLYQNIFNKKIVLITKHIKNIEETLNEYKICIKLFDKIIHLKKEDDKSKYIESKEAIFIDDSFSERINIQRKLKIPVFDTSEVESLIDWREI